ncbi:hypothetical protein BWI17_18000 [Betaproteobacteria bacterium GR16-43]|nr:hypothetical protein BWI17_18000 [Betaproteobacteria bacterium GR16-43]
MAGLSVSGIGSSLDVAGLVEKLMTAERVPVQKLNASESAFQQKLSAYGALKSAMSNLQSGMQSLASATRFLSYSASVSDPTVATASVGPKPATGSYTLEVTNLAQAQKLKSIAFPASDTALGEGTLTIDIGEYTGGAFVPDADASSVTVAVTAGQDGLSKVRDAINTANGGVTATVVNDGTGMRLVVTSKSTGVEHAVRIQVDDADGTDGDASGLSRLAYDASAGGLTQLTEVAAAKDAVAIVDGITVSSATNTLSEAIEGVTINLAKADPGKTHTLNVGRDGNGAKSAVEGFAKQWNDVMKTIGSLTAYNTATKTGSILTGDNTVAAVQNRLRSALNAVAPAGGFGSLAEIGITTNRDGTLALDSSKLSAAIADPTKDVGALFATLGTATDSGITVKSTGAQSEAGSNPIEITRVASRGNATGSLPAATTITAGVNDTLALEVDGTPITIEIPAGSYTAASLATQIQARVNGALAAQSIAIDVTQSSGTLSMASRRYGSESTVKVTGGTAAADLFGTATETAGVDVAGTIGGVVGTGSGRSLSASGFTLEVTGAAGARGAVNFSLGLAGRLDSLLDDLLGDQGSLKARTDGIGISIKDIGSRRDALNDRLVGVEARYKSQFSKLDLALASMQQTSSWLTTQLANLPNGKS